VAVWEESDAEVRLRHQRLVIGAGTHSFEEAAAGDLLVVED
jgi:hypothetical protein